MASPRENVAENPASSLHDHEATLSLTTQRENGNLQEVPFPGTSRCLRGSQRYRAGRTPNGLGPSFFGHLNITPQTLPVVSNTNPSAPHVAPDVSTGTFGNPYQDIQNGSGIASSSHCVHIAAPTELISPIPRLPPQPFSQSWLNAPDDSTPDPQGAVLGESFTEPFPLDLNNANDLTRRISMLADDDRNVFNSCGQNVNVQKAVLAILESNEYKERKCIGYTLALPLLQQVPYSQTNGRDGKRGAPEKYRCLWHGCDWENKRKLRGLEHIRSHVKNRPFICSKCSKGFGRKNELVNHRGCRGTGTPSRPVLRNIAPQVPTMKGFINSALATTNQEQLSTPYADDSRQNLQNYAIDSSIHTNVSYQQFILTPTAPNHSQTDSTQFTSEFNTNPAPQMTSDHFWYNQFQGGSFQDQSNEYHGPY